MPVSQTTSDNVRVTGSRTKNRKKFAQMWWFFRNQSVWVPTYRKTISHFSSWKLQGVTINISPSRIQDRRFIVPLILPSLVIPSAHLTRMWYAPSISSAWANCSFFHFFGSLTRRTGDPSGFTAFGFDLPLLFWVFFFIQPTTQAITMTADLKKIWMDKLSLVSWENRWRELDNYTTGPLLNGAVKRRRFNEIKTWASDISGGTPGNRQVFPRSA